MSWLNRIENIELEIITGDGAIYNPLWQGAEKNVAYNVETFDFVNQPGSYVQRLEKNANQYPILLYFVGDNNIEEAAAFEKSSQNKNPWKVKHPYYDAITVQPISLKFDNKQHNVTIVTGTIIETIQLKAPISAPELVKKIESLNLILNENIGV